MAAYYAYRMTGIVDPMEDFDVIELHDAFTISDVQTYEDIGLRPYGYGRDYVESGDCYHTNPHTGKPGKLPSNLSGGLIGCMHAVGATGIMQVFEIATPPLGPVGRDPRRREALGASSAGRSRRTGPTCRSRAPSGRCPSATRASART